MPSMPGHGVMLGSQGGFVIVNFDISVSFLIQYILYRIYELVQYSSNFVLLFSMGYVNCI